MENLPTRFHIGTQKAGSTYLYNLLASHPGVTLSNHTEVNFFSSHFDKGVEWYAGVFPAGEYVIDVSPTYFKHGSEVARRVAQTHGERRGELRFVLMLRNPVDYLYSHWRMHRMHEYFEAHSKLYPEVPSDIVTFVERYPEYVRRALYSELLDEWAQHFEKEQFKIVVFENFIKNTDEVMRDVLSFWGIPYNPMHVEQASKNKALRFRFLHSLRGWVARHRKLKQALKNSTLFNVVLEKVLTKKTRAELSRKEREALKELLTDDVYRLAGEYGVDVSWWKDFTHITR